VVRTRVTGAEGQTQLACGISQKPSLFTQQGIGSHLSSDLGRVKGGEEEEHPASVTPLLVQAGSLKLILSTRPFVKKTTLTIEWVCGSWKLTG